MIHYHGTPLTPRQKLLEMAGKHFCVSYADPRDAEMCLQIGQSVMWDNGAFSFHTQGKETNWDGFYDWVEPRLAHPHWAVIPDVIDGTPAENHRLVNEWPHRRDCAAVVWHLGEPLGQIGRILDGGFSRLCFGSSAQYWQVGSELWARRCDEAFNWLLQRGPLPWVHMLRGLNMGGERWPFASADSVNVARNYKSSGADPERMARRIDSVQCPIRWEERAIQTKLFA